jgi:glycerate 2-kinase
MKIIVSPDSFKGTLTAVEAAAAIARGVSAVLPEAEIVCLPLADGGEGTVEALVTATGGRTIVTQVCGPLGEIVDAAYGILGDADTAVIEMSAAAGLTLVPTHLRNPLITTTYGVGELIQAALSQGIRRMIIGVGGSATNDGGAGALSALGARFLDSQGKVLGSGGAALVRLETIDLANFTFPTGDVEVTIACDVQNPLIGPNGASYVYGPQKGAAPEMVEVLDQALSTYAGVIKRDHGLDIAVMPGAGAAGGLAGGLVAFLNAQLKPGIEIVLDAVRFDEQARGADLIITGEGRLDVQTSYGKTISGVLKRARAAGARVIAIAGSIGPGADRLRDLGLQAMFSISGKSVSEEDAMKNAAALLEKTTRDAVVSLQQEFSLGGMSF